ncbi:MAG: ligase [Herpetosiphonaceae bacterium]|nr:MAG: ligase [Herpetosiphonaceae bacterium]
MIIDQREPIRRLPMSSEPAAAQLAASAALLKGIEELGRPAMRWYSISPTTVLLGSSQRPHELDLTACSLANIAIHRRGSGGGVVLAGEDLLLLDLAIPREHRLYIADVTRSYSWLGDIWAATLRRLGLDSRVIPVEEARADVRALDPLLKRVCFGGLSPYEIVVAGRKVVGLAQIRRRGGALLQAGVYRHWRPQQTAAVIAAEEHERDVLAERLAARVAGLDDLLDYAPSATIVMKTFESALEELVGLTPVEDGWSEAELAAREGALALYPQLE